MKEHYTYSVILKYHDGDNDFYCTTVEDENPESAWRSAVLKCVDDNQFEDIYPGLNEALEGLVIPWALFQGDIFEDMIFIGPEEFNQ